MKCYLPPKSGAESGRIPSASLVRLYPSLRASFVHRLRTSALGLLAASGALCGIALQPSAHAQTIAVHQYSRAELAHAAGNDAMEVPRILSFETVDGSGNQFRKILLSWQHATDDDKINRVMYSSNNGATWGAPSGATNVNFYAAVRRRDGVVVAYPFNAATRIPPGPNAVSIYQHNYYISNNLGVNWLLNTNGQFNFSSPVSWMRIHRGMFEDNGKLYVLAYAPYTADYPAYGVASRAVLFESTDGGVIWNEKAKLTPADGGAPGEHGYSEPTIERCADGSWLVVVRESHQVQYPLKYTRSTNQGVSWSALAYLPGLGGSNPNPTSYDSNEGNETADPVLKLMPNGVLALSYGRPHCKMAFSADGSGLNWTNKIVTFTETPSASNILGGESYCYTAIHPIGPQTLLHYGDTGAHWSYVTAHPSPNPYSIWFKRIEIVRPQVNRIDLKTKLAQGAITVTTDLTASNASFPEARVAGAFDGNNDYWSGAFKNGATSTTAVSGTYTINLQRDYTIKDLGICLHSGVAQSATVQISTNGTTWTTIQTYPSTTTHYALKYVTLTPTTVRYVRVNVSGVGSVCLNEIELYETSDTFENQPPAPAPFAGWSFPNAGFGLAEVGAPATAGFQSQRALRMHDTGSSTPYARKSGTVLAIKTLEFALKPEAIASTGAIQWRFMSGTTVGFRLRVTPNGQIQYRANNTYYNITGAFAPINTWTRIKVVANATTDTAALYLNGSATAISTSILAESNVANFDAFEFGSGGNAPVGDKALFDDVAFN